MLTSLLTFLVADAVFLVAFILFVVAAFRVRVLYGFIVLFVPLGAPIFALKYPKEGGARFLASLLAYVATLFIAASSPELKSTVGKNLPGVALLAQALGTKDAPSRGRGPATPDDSQGPREAHDVAADEPAPAPAPAATVDPHAAERAALARHSVELNTTYAELNKQRAALKKGSREVAAFNAKAAKYQEGLKSLAAEQAQLYALDHPAAAPKSP